MHCEGMRPLTYIEFVHLCAQQMWAKACSQHKLCCCTLSVGRMHLLSGVLLHMASSMAFAVKSAKLRRAAMIYARVPTKLFSCMLHCPVQRMVSVTCVCLVALCFSPSQLLLEMSC